MHRITAFCFGAERLYCSAPDLLLSQSVKRNEFSALSGISACWRYGPSAVVVSCVEWIVQITSGSRLAGLMVTVRHFPSEEPISKGSHFRWNFADSRAAQETGWTLQRGITRILRCSPDDRMLVTAWEGEPDISGEDDISALPPSGQPAMPDKDTEMAMLSRAAERVGLEWNPPPRAKTL